MPPTTQTPPERERPYRKPCRHAFAGDPENEEAERAGQAKKAAEEQKEEEEEELCAICYDQLPDVGRGVIACVSVLFISLRAVPVEVSIFKHLESMSEVA